MKLHVWFIHTARDWWHLHTARNQDQEWEWDKEWEQWVSILYVYCSHYTETGTGT